MIPPVILISGATGYQGGATLKAISKTTEVSEYSLRALVRSPNSAKAKALDVELVQGDFDDLTSLRKAMVGVSKAFLVTTPFGAGQSPEVEVRQGKAFIDAAVKQGVEHVVFTSVEGAERHSGIPHAESKFQIEQYLKVSGVSWTIIRPVMFMEEVFEPQVTFNLALGLWAFDAYRRGRPLQTVAVDDIGWFCAQALLHPVDYASREIPLAGDALTMAETRQVYHKVCGKRPWNLWFLPNFLVNFIPLSKLYKKTLSWQGGEGYAADIVARRNENPSLLNVESWLKSSPADKSAYA